MKVGEKASVARHVPFVDFPSGYYRILPSSCRHLGGFGVQEGKFPEDLPWKLHGWDDSYGSYGKEVLHITWSVLKWTGMSVWCHCMVQLFWLENFGSGSWSQFLFFVSSSHTGFTCDLGRKFKCFRLKSPCLDVFPSFKITTRLVSLARITPKSWQIILCYT